MLKVEIDKIIAESIDAIKATTRDQVVSQFSDIIASTTRKLVYDEVKKYIDDNVLQDISAACEPLKIAMIKKLPDIFDDMGEQIKKGLAKILKEKIDSEWQLRGIMKAIFS